MQKHANTTTWKLPSTTCTILSLKYMSVPSLSMDQNPKNLSPTALRVFSHLKDCNSSRWQHNRSHFLHKMPIFPTYITCLRLNVWYFSKASCGNEPNSLIFFMHSSFFLSNMPCRFVIFSSSFVSWLIASM